MGSKLEQADESINILNCAVQKGMFNLVKYIFEEHRYISPQTR